jgi:hypothetical protein
MLLHRNIAIVPLVRIVAHADETFTKSARSNDGFPPCLFEITSPTSTAIAQHDAATQATSRNRDPRSRLQAELDGLLLFTLPRRKLPSTSQSSSQGTRRRFAAGHHTRQTRISRTPPCDSLTGDLESRMIR